MDRRDAGPIERHRRRVAAVPGPAVAACDQGPGVTVNATRRAAFGRTGSLLATHT